MLQLPVDSLLPEILATLQTSSNLVLEAPPGAGKTTRVPAALLNAQITDGEVLVLEPRRLAARLAARRVAEERGERLGETVGYQVRFEEVASARTRLRFLTEGVLTRRLLADPQLKNVGAVVLDEFHERHLQGDLALALLRRLQQTARPDLKLVVMSATLEAAPVADFLAAPVLRSEGKRFEVTIEHAAREDNRPLAAQVEAAVRRLINEEIDSDILVFLPGAAEIRAAQASLATGIGKTAELLVLPLHGDLSPNEQDAAVQPAKQRKVILSTNVAESSVTIDGVTAVIDSGLARVAGHSPWSGLPTLSVQRISQAAATQRAGRAGRTRAGRCLRLYTAQDFSARPEHETPEIQRLDLAETALALHTAGIADLRNFAWFEAPAPAALDAAENLLRALGAIDAHGGATEMGRKMLRFPLHPRQARLLCEAEARGVAASGCLLAALIGERDLYQRDVLRSQEADRRARVSSTSDLLEQMDHFGEVARRNFAPHVLRELGLSTSVVHAVRRVHEQLQRLLCTRAADTNDETALLIALLAGYPDRVAKRRTLKADNTELLLAQGGGARLAESSVVQQAEYLIAIDVEERRTAGKTATLVRTASTVEPEWLIDLFAEQLRETTEVRWNAQAERVEVVQRLRYGQLALAESMVTDARDETVARVLADAALIAGLHKFVDAEAVDRWRARVAFLAQAFPEAGVPQFDDEDVRATLLELCNGLRSFAELRAAAKNGLLEILRQKLSAEQQRLLAQHAPEFVSIAGRRQVRVNYENGQAPWIASCLQDFFGMHEGPRVAGGRVPVVLRLLAPNQRPVQVTTDLAGFWQRHYPQIRRELSRRYPRHAWPENPESGSRESEAGSRKSQV